MFQITEDIETTKKFDEWVEYLKKMHRDEPEKNPMTFREMFGHDWEGVYIKQDGISCSMTKEEVLQLKITVK